MFYLSLMEIISTLNLLLFSVLIYQISSYGLAVFLELTSPTFLS